MGCFDDAKPGGVNPIRLQEGGGLLPPEAVQTGSPDDVIWQVPIRDTISGTFVQASVSAPDQATAGRLALRVAENFLFNLTGPLGKILGGALGLIAAKKLVVGGPIIRTDKFPLGMFSWKLSESGGNEGVMVTKLTGYMKRLFAQHPPEGISQESWDACIASAIDEGVEDPEAHCRQKLVNSAMSKGDANNMKAIAAALGLAENSDEATILSAIKTMKDAQTSNTATLTELQKQMAALTQNNLVATYREQVSQLKNLPGTAQELAERLAGYHLKLGEAEAKALLTEWQALNQQRSIATTSTLNGGASRGVATDFDTAVAKFMEANPGKSRAEATRIVMRQQPKLYLGSRSE